MTTVSISVRFLLVMFFFSICSFPGVDFHNSLFPQLDRRSASVVRFLLDFGPSDRCKLHTYIHNVTPLIHIGRQRLCSICYNPGIHQSLHACSLILGTLVVDNYNNKIRSFQLADQWSHQWSDDLRTGGPAVDESCCRPHPSRRQKGRQSRTMLREQDRVLEYCRGLSTSGWCGDYHQLVLY